MSNQAPPGPTSLKDLLSVDVLCTLCVDDVLLEGKDYFEGGQVEVLSRDENSIFAIVHEVVSPRVRLAVLGRRLDFACTCPLGQEGEMCDHVVAVGLTWLEGEKRKGAKPDGK